MEQPQEDGGPKVDRTRLEEDRLDRSREDLMAEELHYWIYFVVGQNDNASKAGADYAIWFANVYV